MITKSKKVKPWTFDGMILHFSDGSTQFMEARPWDKEKETYWITESEAHWKEVFIDSMWETLYKNTGKNLKWVELLNKQ